MRFWRMAPSHLILFLLLSVITEVHPRSFGAPTEACADILPLGHINAGFSSMDVSTIPYALNLSVFDLDGGQSYVPGMTYTITLSGENGEIFRGLLVQARLAVDGITPVGSFQITDSVNTRLSNCTPAESAVTHPSSSIKTSVSVSWTAPAEGTGGILFRYAVVQQFSIFWAPAITDIIQEVQPPPPMFTQPVYQTSVNETFDPTHPRPSAGFITIACIDPDTGAPLTNILYNTSTTSGMVPFAVDSASGALSVTEDLDFDTDPTTYSFSVVCNYTNFPDIGAVGTVQITILPVNEFRPTVVGFSSITQSIDENQPAGTIIAAASGDGLITYGVTDNDAGLDDSTITFTFAAEDTTTDLFSLNFTTGYLVLDQELDLDTGAVGTLLRLGITACDLIPAVNDCPNIQFTLIITPINEFIPAFSQNSYNASVLESAPENSEVVVVECIDADAVVGAFQGINIVSLDPIILDIFDIDSTTGNITLRRQVNFEVDPQNIMFVVECNDTEGLLTTANVSITVEGVNEFPPEFSQPTYEIDAPESTLVGSDLVAAQCTDDDVGVGAFVGIEIVSSDQNILNTFTVDNCTGNITLDRALDFESIQMYEFVIRCFDSEGREVNSSVTINVLAVNEFPPQFSQNSYETSILESFPIDTEVIVASCTDADMSTGALESIDIVSSDPVILEIFAIDSITGNITLRRQVNFEVDPQNFMFMVQCSDTGGLQSTAMVTITIEGVNEFTPEFSQPTYEIDILESALVGVILAVAQCTDDDTGVGAFAGIEIVSTDEEVLDTFAVGRSNGNITLEREVDFESTDRYEFMVRCFDNEGLEALSVVNVSVGDVDEAIQFNQVVYDANVNETFLPTNPRPSDGFITVTCVDPNSFTPLMNTTYNITTDTPLPFDINSETGDLSVTEDLDFESGVTSYSFSVMCSLDIEDGGNITTATDTAVVEITVLAVNEFNPEFSQPAYSASIMESATINTVIVTAMCTDGDLGIGAFERVEIESADQNVLDTFAVEGTSDNITLQQLLNFESIQRYDFTIQCFDNVGTQISSNVTVNVLAVNEFTPQFSQDSYEASVLESTPVDSEVVVATCTDTDVGIGALESIDIVSSDPVILDIFAIDSTTGSITLRRQVNFEVDPQNIMFVVECNDTEGLLTTANVSITVEGVNEFPPEFSQPTYEIDAPESTLVGSDLVAAQCTDDDVGVGAFVGIEIVSSDQNILDTFTVDNSTGNITLDRALDFESIQMYEFVIRCFDSEGREVNSSVTINVLAVNEFSPQFSQDSYETSILESTPVDTEIIVASCTDADMSTGALESIDIASSDPVILDIFAIDSTTGNITLRRQVNFEVDPQNIMFVVECNDTEGLLTTANVIITVEGVNEFPPEFSQPTYEIDAPESTLVGSDLVAAQCTDADVGIGAFVGIEIVSSDQNILNTFTVDNRTGNITLDRALDFESIDFYSFMLRCFDNGGMEAFTLVNVTVGNINDILQFTEPVYEASTNETFIPEYPRPPDGFITVVCVDPDPSIPVMDVTYNIATNFSLPFTINNETGAISVIEDLDFETGNTFYSFTVICTLDSLPDVSNTATVEITISPVNEFRPEILGSSSITRVVLETQMVGTVLASTIGGSLIEYTFDDADAGIADSSVTFTFAEEDQDTSFFSLDLVTGNLTLVRGFDFDNQTEDVFIVSIQITLCDIFPAIDTCPNLDIRLVVASVNEFDPEFLQEVYEASIPESLAVNSEVVVAECFDGDRGTGALARIEIINADQSVMDTFTIDSSTGNITLQQEVDFETTRSYEFTVQCSDAGFNDTAVVNITIEDVNDNSPEPQPINDIMLNDQTQNGTAVTTVVCTDRDTVDSVITYTLDNNLGLFEIATSSGEIITTGLLITNSNVFLQDYELTVMCADSGSAPLTATTVINIQVFKDDSTPPSFTNPTLTADVRENATIGEEVVQFQANDIDSPELQYSLANENFPGLFAINSSTGVITILQTLDREITNNYRTTVVATEVRIAPGTSQSATTQLTINIQDVNDNSPACDNTASRLTATLTAGRYDSTALSVTFSCSDADAGDNSVLRYSLVESTLPTLDDGNFVINEATGELSFQGAIRAGTYTFSVQVSDSGQPPQSITLEVSLTVSSAPDEMPVYVIVVPIVVIVFGLLFIIILVIIILALLRRRRDRGKAKISDIVAKPEDTSTVISHHNVLAAEGEQTVVEMEERTSHQGVEAVIKENPEQGGTDVDPKDAPEGEEAEPEEPVKEKEGDAAHDTAPDKLNDSRQPLLEEGRPKDAKAKADFESTNL